MLQQLTKSDKPSKALGDTLSMLRFKMEEQKQRFFKFKANEALEQEYTSIFLQPISLGMRIVLVLLILQQIITRINYDGAYDEKKRIVFLVFCAAALIVVKFLRFGFQQKLNWIVNIFAVLILADCFETQENKSQLRVFFNGMAFLLCFWIQGQNLLMDGLCILSCFILIHIFRGIDVETGLLTVITLPATLYLKYSYLLKDQQSFIAIKLSEFWLEVSQNVSFVQIIAYSFTKASSAFSFKGCKQSSSQFPLINSDEDLNSLLDRLIISTLEVAPTYQLKEIQRNIGKPLKPVLIKLLDDSKWSFYAKDNKKYIGTALFGDSEFKFNIRGLNSEDQLFILTLGIKDPESLRKENEKIVLRTDLLELSLQNYQQRFEKLSGFFDKEPMDQINSLKVLQRTMESMNAQTDMLKEIAEQIEQKETAQQKKNQILKANASLLGKIPQTATVIYMSDQDKVAQQQQLGQKQDKDNENVLSKGNDEENINKVLKETDDDYVKEEKEKSSLVDRPMAKSHFAKEVKWREGNNSGEEMDLEDSIQYFSLRQIVQDISELYSDEVAVTCRIDYEVMIRGKYIKLRTFLIALFENCLHLAKVDQVSSSLQFTQSRQQENESAFTLEFIVNEKEFYYFQDRENPAYTNGKSLDQAQARAFRYLNGINIPLVQSLEFQQFMKYSELISVKPAQFGQDDNNFQLTVTFQIGLDQQRSSSMTAADRSGLNHQDNKKLQVQLEDDATPPENQILSQYIDDDLKNNESAQHVLQLSRNKSGIHNKSNFRSGKQLLKAQGNIVSSKSIRLSYLMTPKNLEINTNNNIVSYSEQENLIQNLSFPVPGSPLTPENFVSQNRFQPSPNQKKFSNVMNLHSIGKGGLKEELADKHEGASKSASFPFNNKINA